MYIWIHAPAFNTNGIPIQYMSSVCNSQDKDERLLEYVKTPVCFYFRFGTLEIIWKVYVYYHCVRLMSLNDTMTLQLQEVFEQLITHSLKECGTILVIMFFLADGTFFRKQFVCIVFHAMSVTLSPEAVFLMFYVLSSSTMHHAYY